MPNRRGPPLKAGSPDVQRQRELSRHRVQRFRERQRQRKIERTKAAARLQQSQDLIAKSPATTTVNNVTTKSLAQAYIPEVSTIPSDLNQKDLSCRVHFPESIILPGHVVRSISPHSSSSSLFDTSSQSLAAQALTSLSTTTTTPPTRCKCSTSQDLVQNNLGPALSDDNYFNGPNDQPGLRGTSGSTFTRSSSPEDEFFDAVETQITSAIPE